MRTIIEVDDLTKGRERSLYRSAFGANTCDLIILLLGRRYDHIGIVMSGHRIEKDMGTACDVSGHMSYRIAFNARLEKDGKEVLSEEGAGLLSGIRNGHSLTKAASSVGISYRHAWDVIRQTEEMSGRRSSSLCMEVAQREAPFSRLRGRSCLRTSRISHIAFRNSMITCTGTLS